MKKTVAASLFATAFLISSSALAASVQDIKGTALVKKHGGFQKIQEVTSPVEVEPGDTVAVGAKSSAKVVYAEDCWEEVVPGRVVVVREDVDCLNAVTHDDVSRWSFLDQPELTLGLLGAGAAIAVIATAYDVTRTDKPASP